MTTETTTLGNTTLLLDELYATYQTLFNQATTQLEQLDMTDQHIKRLAVAILEDTHLKNRLASLTAQAFTNVIDNAVCYVDQDERLLDRLASRVADRVIDKCQERIEQTCRYAWEAYITSDEVQADLAKRIRLMSDVSDALSISALTKELVSKLSKE